MKKGSDPLFRLALALAFCAAALGARSPQPSLVPDPQAFLDAHNAVRALVRKPDAYVGEWTPLPPLEWSDDVARSAQAWADHLRDDNDCKLVHSDNNYGENLAIGKDLDIAHAVQLWSNEGARYSWSPSYEFEIPTGHYTQMVWRKTRFIGCGIAHCGRTVDVVCQYSPPGNVIGRQPY